MEELISRITSNVGIDEETARRAVSIILSFLKREGDSEKVAELAQRIPGAEAYVDEADSGGGGGGLLGGLGGLMGGGVMAALGQLQGIGLGMGDIQAVTHETIGFAREKAGDDIVSDIVASIPGLSQFV